MTIQSFGQSKCTECNEMALYFLFLAMDMKRLDRFVLRAGPVVLPFFYVKEERIDMVASGLSTANGGRRVI